MGQCQSSKATAAVVDRVVAKAATIPSKKGGRVTARYVNQKLLLKDGAIDDNEPSPTHTEATTDATEELETPREALSPSNSASLSSRNGARHFFRADQETPGKSLTEESLFDNTNDNDDDCSHRAAAPWDETSQVAEAEDNHPDDGSFRVLKVVPPSSSTALIVDEEPPPLPLPKSKKCAPVTKHNTKKKAKDGKKAKLEGPLGPVKFQAQLSAKNIPRPPHSHPQQSASARKARTAPLTVDPEADAIAAVNPSTVSDFSRLQLQIQVAQNHERQQSKVRKLQDRVADVQGYRQLWKDFKSIQQKSKEEEAEQEPTQVDSAPKEIAAPKENEQDKLVLPRASEEAAVPTEDDNASHLSLQTTESWYFDFQKVDFAVPQTGAANANANANGDDNQSLQGSMSLLSESSMQIQRELFRRKRRERKQKRKQLRKRGGMNTPGDGDDHTASSGIGIAGQRFVIATTAPEDDEGTLASRDYGPPSRAAATPREVSFVPPSSTRHNHHHSQHSHHHHHPNGGDCNSVISDLEDASIVSADYGVVRRRRPSTPSAAAPATAVPKPSSIQQRIHSIESALSKLQEKSNVPPPVQTETMTIKAVVPAQQRQLSSATGDYGSGELLLQPNSQHNDETPPMNNTSGNKRQLPTDSPLSHLVSVGQSTPEHVLEEFDDNNNDGDVAAPPKELEVPILDQTADEDDLQGLLRDMPASSSRPGFVPPAPLNNNNGAPQQPKVAIVGLAEETTVQAKPMPPAPTPTVTADPDSYYQPPSALVGNKRSNHKRNNNIVFRQPTQLEIRDETLLQARPFPRASGAATPPPIPIPERPVFATRGVDNGDNDDDNSSDDEEDPFDVIRTADSDDEIEVQVLDALEQEDDVRVDEEEEEDTNSACDAPEIRRPDPPMETAPQAPPMLASSPAAVNNAMRSPSRVVLQSPPSYRELFAAARSIKKLRPPPQSVIPKENRTPDPPQEEPQPFVSEECTLQAEPKADCPETMSSPTSAVDATAGTGDDDTNKSTAFNASIYDMSTEEFLRMSEEPVSLLERAKLDQQGLAMVVDDESAHEHHDDDDEPWDEVTTAVATTTPKQQDSSSCTESLALADQVDAQVQDVLSRYREFEY